MSEVIATPTDEEACERDRLAALHGLAILDTPREVAFDDVAALAARLFQTSVALVTFIDAARQWFKAEIGFGLTETPLSESVCFHAIRHPGVLVVPDLAADPRFANHSCVAAEPKLRFYAAARIETAEGFAVGAVAVADPVPRPGGISPAEIASLEALARQVSSQLELRRAIAERERAVARESAVARRYALIAETTSDAVWDWDITRDTMRWNEGTRGVQGYDQGEIEPERSWWLRRIHPDDRARVEETVRAALASGEGRWAAEYRFRRADGDHADVFDRGSIVRAADGRAQRMVGAMLDLTERNRAAARRVVMAELGERLRDLDDPDAIAVAAAEAIGRALRVDRAGYASVDPEEGTVLAEQGWAFLGEAVGLGRFHFSRLGPVVDALKRGEAVVVSDADTDPRLAGAAEAFAAAGVRAFVKLPVVEQDRLVGVFYLNHGSPRPWTEGDLAFIRTSVHNTLAAAERARIVSALRASEELFRVFAQVMPNQVWATDAKGRIDWLNLQVEAYFGSSAQRYVDAFRDGLVHPDDAEVAAAAWRRSVETGEVYETEFRLRRHDGAYRWFLSRALPIRSDAGAITRWIGTNTDIHEQKLFAAELAAGNRVLSTRVEERTRERDRLWSSTNDLMGTARIDGRLVSVNPAWTRMLGWTQEELLSRPIVDLIDPEDRGTLDQLPARLIAGEAVEGFVNRLRSRDGSTRTVMWSAVPDRAGVHFVGRDITELRHTEEQLRQAQKMEAVGQLTGGIAHDFNNLLTGIIGSLDLLKTRLKQGRTEKLDRYLSAATSSASRAAALTHRLLAFARRQPLDPRPVDVAVLTASLEDLLRRTIGERIGLHIVAEPGLWAILCDPNQLESALLNLAINARDAMADGGDLTIEASNIVLDGTSGALPSGIGTGSFVRLCVSDTGEGMPADVAGRAFDPFFTTKPLGQGTGLGLSMVYGFARQSGGLAEIASEPGRGTRVTMYLPRHHGGAAAVPGGEASASVAHALRDETVLVVEDDAIVRGLVVEVLSEVGLRVVEAVDGPSGLTILQSDARIDLLVSDVGLPAMNGRKMVELARRHRPDLPVLFITGYAENATISGFLEPGTELITKPFSVEALVLRVRTMLEA